MISDFRQYTPGDGTPVTQPTTAYLSYDDKNLYVAFVFKDDPKLIRARLAKRELIMSDDRISICIDTFHDHRHMYWFDVNPYGVQADGNVTDGVEDDPSWDTLWHSEAKITEDGYVGLAAIPFKSIRFPSDEEQTWGLILIRWINRNNESSMWPYVSRRRPGLVQQGGDMTGIRKHLPRTEHSADPLRSVRALALSRAAPPGQPGYQTDTEARAGLDAKAVLKDAFTLDVTLNPDFSQVESDEPQVTVNQRFEVVYPEKRPFFMENGGYFKTPQQLFFSRRIVDPQFGVRLTGKVGTWALGALAVDDRAPGEMVSPDDARYGKKAGIGVVRLQKELRGNSNVAVHGHQLGLRALSQPGLLPRHAAAASAELDPDRPGDEQRYPVDGRQPAVRAGVLPEVGSFRRAFHLRDGLHGSEAPDSMPSSGISTASTSGKQATLWDTCGARNEKRWSVSARL